MRFDMPTGLGEADVTNRSARMRKIALIAMVVSAPLITLSAQEYKTQTRVKKSAARVTSTLDAPNTITGEKAVYSGVVVQARKPGQFWQLFNPKAPLKHGTGEENTARDPLTGRAQGILLLSVKY